MKPSRDYTVSAVYKDLYVYANNLRNIANYLWNTSEQYPKKVEKSQQLSQYANQLEKLRDDIRYAYDLDYQEILQRQNEE